MAEWTVLTNFSVKQVRDCTVLLCPMKHMWTSVDDGMSENRHALHVSQLPPCSNCMTMEPLPCATENTVMSSAWTAACAPHCASFTTWTMYGTLNGHLFTTCQWTSWGRCRWFEKGVLVIQKSSTIILTSSVMETSVRMTVFRAPTNCQTDGLLFASQCKRIAPNVFSGVSWFRFHVSRYLKFFSFITLLHTCYTAPIAVNQPVCEGGGRIHSDFLFRKVQFFTLLIVFLQGSKCLLVLLRQQCKTLCCSRLCATPLKLSKRSSVSLTNMAVATDFLPKESEEKIKKKKNHLKLVVLWNTSNFYNWIIRHCCQ